MRFWNNLNHVRLQPKYLTAKKSLEARNPKALNRRTEILRSLMAE